MLCTNLVVRTPKDGRGISQKQVLEQNLSSTDVHGRTSVERYTDVQLLNRLFSKALEAAHLRFKRLAVRLLLRILTAESRCGFGKLLTG